MNTSFGRFVSIVMILILIVLIVMAVAHVISLAAHTGF